MSEEKKKKRGPMFMLFVVAGVGLLVILPLVALLLGLGIPAYRETIVVRNETVAYQTVKTLATAQHAYKDSLGRYATFDELVETQLIERVFAGERPVLDGYVFTMRVTPPSEGVPAFYSINADPEEAGGWFPTGRARFYFDSEISGIRFNEERTAGPRDRPRE
ncbi:MAG TPA: hypothetical protein VFX96_17435 [Pyrinomonadaceae bacterium]|nr:hypothetical protein [Pyrinomonadaceae bacterium]